MTALLIAAQLSPAEALISQETANNIAGDNLSLKKAVRDLCSQRMALIGEAPTHGDGHTAAFKVALVQQLVTRCNFNTIVFESGRYEFIGLQRALRRGTATPSMVADAVGGLWKFDREFTPLVDFLYAQAQAGHVQLAGMDSQLGGLGETYTNEQMVPELTRGLPAEQARTCNAAFARHTAWDYPADHPYGLVEHEQLLGCAAAMRHADYAYPEADQVARAERDAMIDNIEWTIEPDLRPAADKRIAREQSMFRNILSITQELPQRPKVIVWGATVHLGRNVAPTLSAGKYQTLGDLLHQRYPGKTFTLGFSAKGGSYRIFRKRLSIEPPPPSSLESLMLTSDDQTAVYLQKRQLDRLGILPGGALEHAYHSANWADIVDGMVVFREEWPTHSTRPGYS